MSGPPTDVEPSALFLKLCESPSPSEVYPFPRVGVEKKIRVFVLGVEEHQAARERAHKELRRRFDAAELNSQNLREVYGDMVARELLATAIREVDPIKGSDPPVHAYVFPDVSAFGRAKVTADEMAVLFTLYQLTQQKFGPYEETIANEEELSAWIKVLVEGASASPLARCSWQALVGSSMFLARRAYILSAALVSQWSSLPPTLRSSLESLGIGTTSFGDLPARLCRTAWDGRGSWMRVDDEAIDLIVADAGLGADVKEAARLAESMHKRGE